MTGGSGGKSRKRSSPRPPGSVRKPAEKELLEQELIWKANDGQKPCGAPRDAMPLEVQRKAMNYYCNHFAWEDADAPKLVETSKYWLLECVTRTGPDECPVELKTYPFLADHPANLGVVLMVYEIMAKQGCRKASAFRQTAAELGIRAKNFEAAIQTVCSLYYRHIKEIKGKPRPISLHYDPRFDSLSGLADYSTSGKPNEPDLSILMELIGSASIF